MNIDRRRDSSSTQFQLLFCNLKLQYDWVEFSEIDQSRDPSSPRFAHRPGMQSMKVLPIRKGKFAGFPV